MDYSDLDIPGMLRSAASESTFGEGDPRRSIDLQRLDFLLRQHSPTFTAHGLGEYIMRLDENERRSLLGIRYYLPEAWRRYRSPSPDTEKAAE